MFYLIQKNIINKKRNSKIKLNKSRLFTFHSINFPPARSCPSQSNGTHTNWNHPALKDQKHRDLATKSQYPSKSKSNSPSPIEKSSLKHQPSTEPSRPSVWGAVMAVMAAMAVSAKSAEPTIHANAGWLKHLPGDCGASRQPLLWQTITHNQVRLFRFTSRRRYGLA